MQWERGTPPPPEAGIDATVPVVVAAEDEAVNAMVKGDIDGEVVGWAEEVGDRDEEGVPLKIDREEVA